MMLWFAFLLRDRENRRVINKPLAVLVPFEMLMKHPLVRVKNLVWKNRPFFPSNWKQLSQISQNLGRQIDRANFGLSAPTSERIIIVSWYFNLCPKCLRTSFQQRMRRTLSFGIKQHLWRVCSEIFHNLSTQASTTNSYLFLPATLPPSPMKLPVMKEK